MVSHDPFLFPAIDIVEEPHAGYSENKAVLCYISASWRDIGNMKLFFSPVLLQGESRGFSFLH